MSHNKGQPQRPPSRSAGSPSRTGRNNGPARACKVSQFPERGGDLKEDRDILDLRSNLTEPAGGSSGSRVEPQSVDDGGASGGAEPHLQSDEAPAPGFVEEEAAVPASLAGEGAEELRVERAEADPDEEDAEALEDALVRLTKLQMALELVSEEDADQPAEGAEEPPAADTDTGHLGDARRSQTAEEPIHEPEVLDEDTPVFDDPSLGEARAPDSAESLSDRLMRAAGLPPTAGEGHPADLGDGVPDSTRYDPYAAPAGPVEPPASVAAQTGDWSGGSGAYQSHGRPDAPLSGTQWPPAGAGPVPSLHRGPQPVVERGGLSRYVAVALIALVTGSAAFYFGSQLGTWVGDGSSDPGTAGAPTPTAGAGERTTVAARTSDAGGDQSRSAGGTLGTGEWSRADGASTAGKTAALDLSTEEAGRSPAMGNVPLPSRFAVQPISGEAGTPIDVRIELPYKSLHANSYVMFRGLPGGVRFSAGQPLANAWKVPLERVSDLQLTADKSYSGSFALEVLLVRSPERAPETRIVPVRIAAGPGALAAASPSPATINIGPAPTLRTAAPSAAKPARAAEAKAGDAGARPAASGGRVASVAPSAPAAAVSAEVETSWLTRGKQMMDNGDVAGARLAFEHLVALGSAKGALALARSYDPEVLERIAFFGPKPDVKQAIAWYRKAAELGSEAARQRLKQLAP